MCFIHLNYRWVWTLEYTPADGILVIIESENGWKYCKLWQECQRWGERFFNSLRSHYKSYTWGWCLLLPIFFCGHQFPLPLIVSFPFRPYILPIVRKLHFPFMVHEYLFRDKKVSSYQTCSFRCSELRPWLMIGCRVVVFFFLPLIIVYCLKLTILTSNPTYHKLCS